MGPGALSEILANLPNIKDPNLLVGFDTSDDACVYQINSETAIIQTVDFFTPVADDPYIFGQIAAANALSDVYAMGGKPILAMNLLCIPNCLPQDVIRDILRGGHDKAIEAGCVVAGGHTIEDAEPKYGLCVTGMVHPAKALRNVGARPGDVLVLTKPLGSGIVVTAKKAEIISDADFNEAVENMCRLNKEASAALCECREIHACTDVTGFGLLGHAFEMASGSAVTIELDSAAVPLLSAAKDFAEMGIIPGGAYRNRDYVMPSCFVNESVEEALVDIMCDPQTSGGLLVALAPDDAAILLENLKKSDHRCSIIGKATEKQEKSIIIK